jgi:hypothetical protein
MARRKSGKSARRAARKAREGAPRTSQPPVDKYRKRAVGEKLTYPAPNLSRYRGEKFCFRITLGDMHLDSCFFVYLDERFEDVSLRRLFENYLITPTSEQIAEMESWLASWKGLDPNLSKKYSLLRQMFAKIQERSGSVTYHINHGPSNFNLGDTVQRHLGTSIFDDNSYNDKILDVVLEFRITGNAPREQREWKQFGLIHSPPSSPSGQESSWQSSDPDRRDVLNFILGVAAVLVLPFLVFSCMSDEGSSGGSGYVGGGL